MIAISPRNHTWQAIRQTGRLGLQMLHKNQTYLALPFGCRSSRDYDKFAGLTLEEQTEMPFVTGSCGWIEADVIERHETTERELTICRETRSYLAPKEQRVPMTMADLKEHLSEEDLAQLAKKKQEMAKNVTC